MEPPSAPGHRGHVPWHRLLLAVSLLSFWNLPATAQITIESVPFKTAEGRDVLLLAHNATEDTLGYSWYRGERVENNQLIILYRVDIQANTTGPAYSGREIIYPNGSLLFQNATQNDTGYYTLMVTKNDLQREIVTGLLRVYPPADILCRKKDQSDGSNSTEGDQTPCDHDPEEDPVGLSRGLASGPPGSLTEKLSPRKPLLGPCPRAPASSDPRGSVPLLGSGLLDKADGEQRVPSCLSPKALSCSPVRAQPQEPHVGRGGAWSFT
uniref:Immunoglobulin V-set domain-containing protein n=1 Tax=Sus scrofa TaxID=9823 RepID=A0A8D0TJR4_PIG